MEAELLNVVVSALGSVLVALVGYLAQKLARYLTEKGVTEKLASKQYLVDVAVLAVEQLYQEEGGEKKFGLAKMRAVDLLNQQGIEVSNEELESFIEASVKSMNEGFLMGKEV